MYQDFNNLSDFYKTNIGRSLKNLISEKIKKYVFLYDHEHVGFVGFSEPYSDLLKNKKIKVFNFFPAKLGISKNNPKENSLNILHDEEQLPAEDLFFNHLVGVHYIENTSNLKKTLRELWRVLAPEGKIYLIIPNKKSSWSMSATSPFSSGFGFSKKQISDLLEENFYDIQFIDRLVYFPPWKLKILSNHYLLFEKLGSYFWRFFNGVYLCVAKKRIYSTTSLKPSGILRKTKVISR